MSSACFVQAELEGLSKEMGRSLRVLIRHVERVKWYAPHIRHVVLDVECRPHQATSPASEQATFPAPDQAMDHPPDQATRPAPDQATHAAPEQAAGPAPDQAASQGRSCSTVAEHIGVTREEFERCISAKKEPAVLKGLHLGPAVARSATQMILTFSLLCITTMYRHSVTEMHMPKQETQRTQWNIAPCRDAHHKNVCRWSGNYLKSLPCSSTTLVSVHVCPDLTGEHLSS